MKNLDKLSKVFAAAFFILGMFFLFRSCCHASEIYHYECRHALHHSQRVATTPAEWQELVKFHSENAKRCFEDAKNKCWWLPNSGDRKHARYCFETTAILLMPGPAGAKAIAAISNLMIKYGLDAMDEWDYINNKLYYAQYHCEMCDHYQNMLDKYYL